MIIKNGRRAARVLVSAVAVAALLATSAEAAMLANVEGSVSVNRGDGFRPTDGGSVVPGDRIRTGAGSASIVYENGCSTRIGPNQTVVVLSSPPGCNAGLKDGEVAPASFGVPPILLGGLVVGGAVGLAVALSDNHNNPHSP
ncbi:MAG: hypothetical protein WAN43_12600 [Rhodomicrobium sp.]